MNLVSLRTQAAHSLERLLTFPTRRPILTLGIAAAVVVFAVAGIFRLKANTSLEALFPRGNPSADALVRVLDAYPASGELILLASVPDDKPPAPEALLAFARRFQQAVADSPEAAALTAGVAFAPDPDFRRFIEQVLVPSGLYYLDDETFARARQRMTAEGIREQIAQNESLISQPGPAAGAAAKQLLKDPLRLHEFVKERFAAQRQFATWQGGEEFISPDGRAILIRIAGTRSSSDLDYCAQLMQAITSVASAANSGGLTLDYVGAYAAADFSHQSIRGDSIVSIFTSVILLQLLFLFFYRRPFRQFLLEIVPILLGIAVGFGVYGWVRGSISPIAAVVGGILAGLGLDYSVVYLAAYFRHLRDGKSPVEAIRLTATRTAPAMFAAWLTSAIGFVAVAWSSVLTLRDFALLGALGLLFAFAAVVLFLPAVVSVWDARRLAKSDTPEARRMPFRFRIENILNRVERHRVALLGLSLTVLFAALVLAATRPGGPIPLESDLHVMHPQPNPPLDAEAKIAGRFGASPGGLLVHLRADSAPALVNLSHEVDRRLSQPGVRSAGVAGTFGLSTLLPEPAAVERRRGVISKAEIDRIVTDFTLAVENSLFDVKQYDGYVGFLRLALSQQQAPALDDLRKYPALSRSLLPRESTTLGTPVNESIMLVFVDRPMEERSQREALVTQTRAALAGMPGVTLTGLSVISMDTETAIRKDLPMLVSIAFTLVLAYLVFHFRSPFRVALALTPAIFSFAVLAGAARLFDLHLNLVNLVALPLLLGINADFGIYLVTLADRRRYGHAGNAEGVTNPPPMVERMAASAQALLVCAASSGLGFISLTTVSVPAIRSIGLAVAIGVASCVFGTFCLLAPLLMMFEQRRTARLRS